MKIWLVKIFNEKEFVVQVSVNVVGIFMIMKVFYIYELLNVNDSEFFIMEKYLGILFYDLLRF